MTDALAEEGYGVICTCSADEANSIFWDRSRVEPVSHIEQGGTLAVDFWLLGSSTQSFRVVCLQGKIQYGAGFGSIFGNSRKRGCFNPLIVCADLRALGGAECAAVVEELGCLPSVMQEVFNEELAAPLGKRDVVGNCMATVISDAHGLNKLHRPDAILYSEVKPVAVLSGHTEGYLATMPLEEVLKQFPSLRLPMVCAFLWPPRG